MFVDVGNGLPAALPHPSSRLKILMAFHWCCRVTPGQSTRGSVSQENSCFRGSGGKSAGRSWCGPNRRVRSETKVGPPGAYPRCLRLGRYPVMVIKNCFPIYPTGGRYPWKTLVLEISGSKCVRRRG